MYRGLGVRRRRAPAANPPAPLALPNKPSAAQDADAGGAVFTSSFSREVATWLFLPVASAMPAGHVV